MFYKKKSIETIYINVIPNTEHYLEVGEYNYFLNKPWKYFKIPSEIKPVLLSERENLVEDFYGKWYKKEWEYLIKYDGEYFIVYKYRKKWVNVYIADFDIWRVDKNMNVKVELRI